jgi:hypothetical protein
MPASSLYVENPEKERDEAVGIHDVKHNTLVLLSLEKALEHAASHKPGHDEIKNMNKILEKYHVSYPP